MAYSMWGAHTMTRKENEENKIFVGGLSQVTTQESLRQHFETYGEMTDCVVMMESGTGRSRGFGFVTFVSKDALEAVLSSKQIVDGKEVDCKKACPREIMNLNNGAPPKSPSAGVFRTDKIFVGGLPDLTTEEFREYFEKFGTVLEATLMTDKHTNKPRGFGFVTFESPNVVNEVIRRYNEHTLKGKWVEVKKATPRESLSKGSKNHHSPKQTAPSVAPPFYDAYSSYPDRYNPDKLSALPPHHLPPAAPLSYSNDRSAYVDRPSGYANPDKPIYGSSGDVPWANDRSAYVDRSPSNHPGGQVPMPSDRPVGFGFPPNVNYTYSSYGDKNISPGGPNYNFNEPVHRQHNPYDRPEDVRPLASADPYGMAQYSSATTSYDKGVNRGYNDTTRGYRPTTSYVPARTRPNMVTRQVPY